jgi:hypothetical protein
MFDDARAQEVISKWKRIVSKEELGEYACS